MVKPGNTKTSIDKGVWTAGSNDRELKAVQGFNDWWRRTFGNDPRIDKDKVHIGFDAKLGNALVRTVPYWRQIFFLGSYGIYELVKKAQALKN